MVPRYGISHTVISNTALIVTMGVKSGTLDIMSTYSII